MCSYVQDSDRVILHLYCVLQVIWYCELLLRLLSQVPISTRLVLALVYLFCLDAFFY
jgi:hypothetical protein